MSAHLGFAWGIPLTALGRRTTLSGSFDFGLPYDPFKGTGSYFAGLQAGYNHRLPSGLVIGIEADVAAPNTIRDAQTIASPAIGQASLAENVQMSGTIRGRLGYVHGNWLVYGTAGYAWSYDHFIRTTDSARPIGGTAVPGTVEKANA
jgi:high affinity Mn2+ porin